MYDNQRMNSHSIATELATEWCEWRIDFMHIYIIQSSDTNVKACGCDWLYRTISKFSFLLFSSSYETVNLSAVSSI